MKVPITTMVISLLASSFAGAAAVFTGGVYTQNFDSMGAAGTAPPTDWIAGSYATVQNRLDPGSALVAAVLLVDDGSAAGAGSKNYGTTGQPDRALGSLPTTAAGDRGLQLAMTNNTGSTINFLTIAYTGEQWRASQGTSSSGPEMLRLYLSPTNGTGYTSLGSSLNFTAPQDTASNAALDGNLAANRTAISATVDLVALGYGGIAAGANFFITWHDWNDNATTDHALAVDDVRITAVPEPSGALLAGLGVLLLARRRRSSVA